MAANLLARYIWEINTIAKSNYGLTLQELNEKWEDCVFYDEKPIVRKTWYEHRRQIGIQFHIDIECDKRTNRYYIAIDDKIGQPELQQWLLNSFSTGNMLLEGQGLKGRILCEKIPSGYRYLTPIIQAMRESKIVSITYQSFTRKEPSTFELKPYALRVFNRRWYLIAGNVAFEGIRVYALDRMLNLELTQDKFKLPRGFDAQRLYENVYGSTLPQDDKVEPIVVRAYNGEDAYLRSLKLHHSQKERSTNANYTEFEFRLKPTYEFIQALLSYGPDVEVIEPATLRQTIKQRIKAMNKLYK